MTRIFRRFAFAMVTAMTLGALALPVVGQEIAPEQLALARKYVELTDKSGVYERSLINTGVETMRTILSQNPEISDALEKAIKTTLDGYKERKGELIDQFARLYAARFNTEELQQIVDFYTSPVGLKLADQTALLNSDMQLVMRVWETNLRGEFYAKVRAELKAAGFNV